MAEVIWGVRRTYEARYDSRAEAQHYAEEDGELVYSEDGGETWKDM